jgi:D-alanyl-D-alanine endopeptidase (penicillin-binding protein 7)
MKKLLILLALVTTGVSAREASVMHLDISENKVEYNKKISDVRPLASITKLMTAMVSLDYDDDLNRLVELKPLASTSLPVRKYTRNDLFHAMLIRSDNGAAETIASDYPGGRKMFIEAMNKKALQIGMLNTYFKDPTGLSSSNTSTAINVANMVMAASYYSVIRETSIKKQALFEAMYKKKIRTIRLKNTNQPLLFEFDQIIISKTGFTNPAGWCVALMVEKKEKVILEEGFIERVTRWIKQEPKEDDYVTHHHVIVILGAKNKQDRIDKVKQIMYNEILDTDIQESTNENETSNGENQKSPRI